MEGTCRADVDGAGAGNDGKTRPRLASRGLTFHSPTTMFPSNPRPLPQRTHSVNAVKHANYFGSIDEELRDCKRVQRQGQEEDLREALTRVMARVEEMVRTLLLMLSAIALEVVLTDG